MLHVCDAGSLLRRGVSKAFVRGSEVIEHWLQGVQYLLLPGVTDEESAVSHLGVNHHSCWVLGIGQLLLDHVPGHQVILG